MGWQPCPKIEIAMKILFLPVNVASMQTITAAALNQFEGIEAHCIVDQQNPDANVNETVLVIPRTSKKELFKSIYYALTYFKKIKHWIEWADVLHYVYTPGDKFHRDLKYAYNLRKKIFVEYVGSDIRVPQLLAEINPYYKFLLDSKLFEYSAVEKNNGNYELQNVFHKYGAIPIVNPEMKIYLKPNLYPKVVDLFIRIDVENINPIFPTLDTSKIRIVHSPSAKYAKGSQYIIPLINKLSQIYPIDFVLNHKRPRQEVLDTLVYADIFIDQIIAGSYGMASIEAMAYGKPTICYIMNEVFNNGLPRSCPIVNANPDTLEEKLVELIESACLRREIGIRSRKFVEEYHNVNSIAHQLLKVYNS